MTFGGKESIKVTMHGRRDKYESMITSLQPKPIKPMKVLMSRLVRRANLFLRVMPLACTRTDLTWTDLVKEHSVASAAVPLNTVIDWHTNLQSLYNTLNTTVISTCWVQSTLAITTLRFFLPFIFSLNCLFEL